MATAPAHHHTALTTPFSAGLRNSPLSLSDSTRYNAQDIAQHLSTCLCYDSSVEPGVCVNGNVHYACSFRNNTTGDAFTDNDTISREIVGLMRKLRLPMYMVQGKKSKRNRAGVITTTFQLVLPVVLTRDEETATCAV